MVRILTDSTADIDRELAASWNIEVVPLRVIFGDTALRDGVEITNEQFYFRLSTADAMPTTSCPTPEDFLTHFKSAVEAGDSIVAILLSSALSGTYGSALLAREMIEGGDIQIVDSRYASCGLQILIEQAVLMRDEGRTAAEIAAAVTEMRQRISLFVMVDTLKYLYKGGRLSRGSALAGSVLGVKPILTMKDGALVPLDKVRGSQRAVARLLDLSEANLPMDESGSLFFAYAADTRKCGYLRAAARERFGHRREIMCSIGSVIGTHIGPGACVICFLKKK